MKLQRTQYQIFYAELILKLINDFILPVFELKYILFIKFIQFSINIIYNQFKVFSDIMYKDINYKIFLKCHLKILTEKLEIFKILFN